MTGSESPEKIPTFRESENSAFSRIRPKADVAEGAPSVFPSSFNGLPPPADAPLDLRPKPSLPPMYDLYGRELDPYMGLSRYEGGAGYPLPYGRPSFLAYTDPRLPITNYYITMARLQMEHSLRQQQQAAPHTAPHEDSGDKGGAGGDSPTSSRADSGRDSPEEGVDDDEEEEVDVEEQSEPETETSVSPKPEQPTAGPTTLEGIRPPDQLPPPPFLHLPPFPPSAHHPPPLPTDAPHALPRVPGLDFPAFLGSPFGSPAGLVHPAFFPPGGPLVPTPGPGRQRDPSKPPPLKKYKCDVCAKAFSRSNTLVTHKVSCHRNRKLDDMYYNDATWESRRHKSSASLLFVQRLNQATKKVGLNY